MKPPTRMTQRAGAARRPRNALGALTLVLVVLGLVCAPGPGFSQPPLDAVRMADGPYESEYNRLLASIAASIAVEEEQTATLTTQLEQARNAAKALAADINAVKIQISTHGNLLHIPETPIEDIERARAEHRASLESVEARLKALTEKKANISILLDQTEAQFALNQKQLLEINAEGFSASENQTVADRLQRLIGALVAKIQLLEKLNAVYTAGVEQLSEVKTELSELSIKFDQTIAERKKQALFQRKENPLFSLQWEKLLRELQPLEGRARMLLSQKFWLSETAALQNAGAFFYIAFVLLLITVFLLLLHLKLYFLRLESRRNMAASTPVTFIALRLFHRSLIPLGAALIIYAYANLQGVYAAAPILQTVVHMLLAWAFTRWGLDFLNLWAVHGPRKILPALLAHLRTLFRLIRYFSLAYLFLRWWLGSASIVLLFARLFFEITLIAWGILLWKVLKAHEAASAAPPPKWATYMKNAVLAAGDVIAIGALLAEFTGFGSLALYWLTSWGRTLAVAFWGILIFFSLREHALFKPSETAAPDEGLKLIDPVRWMAFWLSWFGWIATLIMFLVFAWSGRPSVGVRFFKLLGNPFSVGEMRISILGFLYAFIALLLTYYAVKIWRHVFQEKFLSDSGLEPGLKDSITTITIYLLWAFGIILALHVVGVSAASLAVVFGALGIGLGFGLQNIFNNFISGVILLFERPIQVGDAIEVNGVWGEVKKINVRATLVQTYDNASLIIPNSEFISSQVTNWSFKDPRVRRSITVGAAYGSDVQLVRDTLMEIVDNHPRALKFPHPYVLFMDFGDSALIFQVRFWTDVVYFLHTETDIRFEIDRLFRERNIRIPFPQRDVHLYAAGGNPAFETDHDDAKGPAAPAGVAP